MSNRQGVTYDADNLVNLTPGSLTYNGATYDVTAAGSATAAQATANAALAAAAAAQATANAALPKAGGTMTGQIDMSNQKIVSLGTPTVSTDAATKGYVDTSVVGLLDLQGTINCSTNPNYPSANKGDVWVVSVAGLIGGGAGISVQAGDALVALADNPGGTQAAVGSSWSILQANLVGALLAVNNLSDVQSVATARTNLGLGTAATQNSTAFATAAQGTLASTAVQRAGDSMTGNLSVTLVTNGTAGFATTNTDAGTSAQANLACTSNGGTFYFGAASTASVFGGGGFLYTNANTPLTLWTWNTKRMTIPGNGDATLHTGLAVQGAISTTGDVSVTKNTAGATTVGITNTNAAGQPQFSATSNGGTFYFGAGYTGGAFGGGGFIYTASAVPLSMWTNNTKRLEVTGTGNVGVGGVTPTARFMLPAGTASANTAPLKFTSGTNLTAAEAGAMEYNGTLSFTDSSAVRKDVALKTTYTPTLTPALIVSTGYTEQTFTVTGLATTDTVIVNGPAAAVNSVLVHARVSAANTLALTWITDAANITPTSGTYRIVAIRS